MSESKGLTLRKKGGRRPQISAPQKINPPGTTRPSQALTPTISRERNPPSETSDLIKRRYSTRFNQLPDFSSGAPAVPGLPANPKSSQGPQVKRPGPAPSGGPLRIDIDALSNPNLQHERYVTDLLSNASEQEIQDFQTSLRKMKRRTSTDLQQNVYQNRTQFIKISKEAEKLKSEMVTLQALMSELTGALGQTGASSGVDGMLSPDTNGDVQSRRRANRSSLANLESMWNIQLQALWKNVEKSQKFLPATPGRHIMMETGRWIELDSATWKPKRPVHIVLLNDHLLVASKKRKRVDPNVAQKGPAPTKLVAEECWPLADINLVDLRANLTLEDTIPSNIDDRAVMTAITVRSVSSAGKSFTYRHEQRDETAKNELLLTFRKAAEDLRKTALAETATSPTQDQLTQFAARDLSPTQKQAILPAFPTSPSLNAPDLQVQVQLTIDDKLQTRPLRWLESQIDDLDIEIALQRLANAINLVESLRDLARSIKANTVAQELFSAKLEQRASKLASVLLRQLVDTPAFLEATKTTIGFLTRLGYEGKAREAYLDARSQTLNTRARQCIFEGDLPRYVFQISYVYFTVVKNTILIYQACFSPAMMGASVVWAVGVLEGFNALLRRQMAPLAAGNGSAIGGSAVWKECLQTVEDLEREILGEVGVDFREIVGRGIPGWRGAAIPTVQEKKEHSRSKSRSRTPARN